jgi:hypothetical protein
MRHRLNRGGDRAANSALWTIANNRLMHEPRSRAYAAKRTALGDSRKEILRCVKRALARELHPLILDALTPHPRHRGIKLAVRYQATVCVADIFIWLRARPDRARGDPRNTP